MGVTIDIGGKSVEIATSADVTKHFADLYDWIIDSTSREELVKELPDGVPGTKTTPASPLAWTFFDLGGPKVGWLWDVMRLNINGNDPTATIAGNVFAFIGGSTQPRDVAASDPLGPVFEVGTGTIPNVAYYGRQQVTLHPGQHVIIGTKGLPASTQVFVGGQAVQYRDPSAGTPVNPVRKSR